MSIRSDTSSHATATKHPSSSLRIRNKFFNKLGIDQIPSVPEVSPRMRSLLGKVRVTLEPLKYKEYNPNQQQERPSFLARLFGRQPEKSLPPSIPSSTDTSSVSSSGSSHSSKSSKSAKRTRRKLTFKEEVKVVPIPKREEYSERVRDRLWANSQEIRANAERNALEFKSEGWDWRSALEDENMYTCIETGNLIHPVHCEPGFEVARTARST